jgi:hypothetical protein
MLRTLELLLALRQLLSQPHNRVPAGAHLGVGALNPR